MHPEVEMETSSEVDRVVDTSGYSPSAWQEPDQDPLPRAEAIVSDYINQIFDGCEAVLVLPKADPAIPLMKEIAEKASSP